MTHEISETLVDRSDIQQKWKVSSGQFTAYYIVRTGESRSSSAKRWAAFQAVIVAAFK